MKSKRSIVLSTQPSFQPYTIHIPNYNKIKTLEQLLTSVFSIPLEEDTKPDEIQIIHTEKVDETFLLSLAHGIQGLDDYNPDITPSEVLLAVQSLMKKYPQREQACQYFLSQYEIIIQSHGPKKIELSHRIIEWLTPRSMEHPLPFCCFSEKSESHSNAGFKENKQIEAMANDILLLHMNNYLHLHKHYIDLGKPIPEKNPIITSFNKLLELITTDISSSKEDLKLARKKVKIYLAVAKKLMSGPIHDLEGAAIITYALNYNSTLIDNLKDKNLKNDIEELTNTFSIMSNYKNLRDKMLKPNCIPLFMVITKDLQFCKENVFWDKVILQGKQYAYLAQKNSELKSETKKQRMFHPTYQTNLSQLVEDNELVIKPNNDLTIKPREEKEIFRNTQSLTLTRKPRRHSLSITLSAQSNTLVNSSSTPSLVCADNNIENPSQKRKLQKIETKAWDRESLNLKLSQIKSEVPELKSERSYRKPQNNNNSPLQQHSHFSPSNSRRFSDPVSLTSSRESAKILPQNNEEKIENLSIKKPGK